MSRTLDTSITWPAACIGCGTDQDLVLHERNIVKIGRSLKKLYPTLTKQAQLYLCPVCSENAGHEEKRLRNQGKSGFVISLILAAVGVILINQFYLDTFGLVSLLYSILALSWFPLSNLTSINSFRNRHPTEYYYNVRTVTSPFFFGTNFKNPVYSDIFAKANPDIVLLGWIDLQIASNSPNFVISSLISIITLIGLGNMVLFGYAGGWFGSVLHILWIAIIYYVLSFYQKDNSNEIISKNSVRENAD